MNTLARKLATSLAAALLALAGVAPAHATTGGNVKECVEKFFYVYITEPHDPWSPDDCLPQG